MRRALDVAFEVVAFMVILCGAAFGTGWLLVSVWSVSTGGLP
jgi:hypothetical protein